MTSNPEKLEPARGGLQRVKRAFARARLRPALSVAAARAEGAGLEPEPSESAARVSAVHRALRFQPSALLLTVEGGECPG